MVALDLSTKHVGHSLGSCGVSGEGFSETGPSWLPPLRISCSSKDLEIEMKYGNDN